MIAGHITFPFSSSCFRFPFLSSPQSQTKEVYIIIFNS
ncbi:protein of unknown function [Paraburkholderia dioscoreae]|uniref:Uncharacterized protein n=1 Tax=Paraburkholderia dioscoreae TaxID=2604047 RepID=A0A5Q4Z7Z4_9BURK|nr:protein of unknown function [Paraburkholderia dioscoreae]